MIRCQQCRKENVELLSTWERIKNWLFHKLFPEDIQDLSQNKYTQGFTDGLLEGRRIQRENDQDMMKKYHGIDL